MKLNEKSLLGFTTVVSIVLVVLYAHFREEAASRQQHLALVHFELLAKMICTEARAQISEQTASGIQQVLKAGSSTTMEPGKAELAYDWEITPKSSVASNLDLRVIAEGVEPLLQQIAADEQSVLSCYYPKMRITVETTVVDSKFFNKPAILVTLKCNS